MASGPRPVVLAVDDDPSVLTSLSKSLARVGYDVHVAESADQALAMLETLTPHVILLDVIFPGTVDGFELCQTIHADERLAYVPIVFVTGLQGEQDEARAFAAGGAGYVRKPFELEDLVREMDRHLSTGRTWERLRPPEVEWSDWVAPDSFPRFKDYLIGERRADPDRAEETERCAAADLYDLVRIQNIPEEQVARHLAHFLQLPFVQRLSADDIALGVLPRAFCERNLVVPVHMPDGQVGIVLANPFLWDLLETLNRSVWRDHRPLVSIAAPDTIQELFEDPEDRVLEVAAGDVVTLSPHGGPDNDHPIQALATELLTAAVKERASDLHIEPKDRHTLVRFRIDGEMQDIRTLDHTQARRVVSRFKAQSGMDIAERRKPQDGSVEVFVDERRLKLRLATSSTSDGESLVIRILEPTRSAVPLVALGMAPGQVETVQGMCARHQGMLLMVGPTGSGKSTTIFSLLTNVDGRTRSIMSVEDPVEYRIPFANQQQVNERAGVTFELLLRSAMRQDPDIFFLGEIRDQYSAKASLDFASSGHLTLSTLHSANASTAVFRLERLGVERSSMADSILGIVAQKLLRRLCPHCKAVGPVSPEEAAYLGDFTPDVPERVARPVGCPACRETGYIGRDGVFEVLRFDPAFSELVRSGASVARVRQFSVGRGDFMVYDHAIEKVREGICSPKDAYEMVLLEEMRFRQASDARRTLGIEAGVRTPPADAGLHPSVSSPSREERRAAAEDGAAPTGGPAAAPGAEGGPSGSPAGEDAAGHILVVEDDPIARRLVARVLEKEGFVTASADDGVEALLALGREAFDLVVSDLNMPNLDGHKLLEMLMLKDVHTPVIFLTGETDPDTEGRALEAGAVDFIKKPLNPAILLGRVRNVLRRRSLLSA